MVTLHLLDSRPLNETLATLLSQRSKTLQSILAWNFSAPASKQTKSPLIGNGHIPSAKPVPMREVAQTMKRALSAIAQTIITARTIFKDEPAKASLIVRVLRSMQEDQSETTKDTLPDDLYLTTQSLLTHLTSSANFQLLPTTLRLYKPYVDLSSSSTLLDHAELSQRLEEWFKSSSDQWRHSAAQWFLGLQSIKEVWTLRNSIRRYVTNSGLLKEEKIHILSDFDSLCHERTLGIWQNLLSDTETKFKKSLHDNISLSPQTEGIKGTKSKLKCTPISDAELSSFQTIRSLSSGFPIPTSVNTHPRPDC